MDGSLPMALFGEIVGEVKTAFPSAKAPRNVAQVAYRVWEKMQVRPPSTGATVAILLVYLGGCLFACMLAIVLLLIRMAPHAKP